MSEINESGNDISGLTEELRKLNGHRFMRVNATVRAAMWYQFLRGLAFGFGSVVGATIVVSLVGFILGQMEVVPVIGDWATEIGREILRDGP